MGGCGLVIWGWTVIGLILEAYGFWLLFCEFIPTALQFFRRVPLMSRVLDAPVMKTVSACRFIPFLLLVSLLITHTSASSLFVQAFTDFC